MIPENYERRLKNYLLWATMGSVGTAGSVRGLCAPVPSADGLSPEEVMYRWESKGDKSLPCSDHTRLYRYAAGKAIRDFYVSNWAKDVRDGLVVAEELICTGGMDLEEFFHVFKRHADPWLLKRMWSTPAQTETAQKQGGGFCGTGPEWGAFVKHMEETVEKAEEHRRISDLANLFSSAAEEPRG